MMKSFVNELVGLSSIQSVGQAFDNRLQEQSRRSDRIQDSSEVRARIQSRQQDIQGKNESIQNYTAQLEEAEANKAQLENAINNAPALPESGSGDSGDGLDAQRAQLEHLEQGIAAIQSSLDELQQDITELNSLTVGDQEILSAHQRALSATQEGLVNVRGLVDKTKLRFDSEALHTGEESLEEQKKDSIRVDQQVRRENARLKEKSELGKERTKRVISNEVQQVDNQERAELQLPLRFLPAEQLSLLRSVFDAPDINALSEQLDKELPVVQNAKNGRQPSAAFAVDEGLAIVLQSALRASDSSENPNSRAASPDASVEKRNNPSASTFRGDNLSFEGAKNPRIFSELWLEAQMKQGDDTQDKKEVQLDKGEETVQVSKSVRQASFVDALQEFAGIPDETAESLAKAEEAEAYISRNSRV